MTRESEGSQHPEKNKEWQAKVADMSSEDMLAVSIDELLAYVEDSESSDKPSSELPQLPLKKYSLTLRSLQQ